MQTTHLGERAEVDHGAAVRMVLLLVVLLLPLAGWAKPPVQPDVSVVLQKITGPVPAKTAHITGYTLDDPVPGSKDQTGSLHIQYSDHTVVTVTLAEVTALSRAYAVRAAEGFDTPMIAAGGRTIAWTNEYAMCCENYTLPADIAIYSSGKTIRYLFQGQVVWNWQFIDKGKRLVGVWGAAHFQQGLDYQLYDARTGKVLAEVFGNEKTECPYPNAPQWVKRAEPSNLACSAQTRMHQSSSF